jgi:YggT family protein
MEFLGHLLVFVINSYFFLLILRVLLSWFTIPPKKWVLLLYKITEPVLKFFRDNIPIKIGAFDLSAIVPLLLLPICSTIINDLMVNQQTLSIFYFLIRLIELIDGAVGFIMFLFVIFTAAVIVINHSAPGSYNPIFVSIRAILDPIVSLIKRIIKINSRHSETIYLILTIVFFLLISIIMHIIFANLIALLKGYSIKTMINPNNPDKEFDFR